MNISLDPIFVKVVTFWSTCSNIVCNTAGHGLDSDRSDLKKFRLDSDLVLCPIEYNFVSLDQI